jgi:hypothetical protein
VQTGTRVVVLPGKPPETVANTAAPAGTAGAAPTAPRAAISSSPLPAAR